MRAREIIPAGIWAASAVAVFGYTWQAMAGGFQPFPTIAGGFSPADIASAAANALTNVANSITNSSGIFGLDKLLGTLGVPALPNPATVGGLHQLPGPPAQLEQNMVMAINSSNKQGSITALQQLHAWFTKQPGPNGSPQSFSSWLGSRPWYKKFLQLQGVKFP